MSGACNSNKEKKECILNFGSKPAKSARAVRRVSSHFEYLENRSRGLDVTWQLFRGDLIVCL